MLLISHDRDLLEPRGQLDRASRQAEADLLARRLRPVRAAADRAARAAGKGRVKQEAARKHLQSFVDRFRAKASKARQAQSRIKALEKMKPIAALVDDTVRPFQLPRAGEDRRLADHRPARRRCRLCVGKPVLKKMTLRIDADDRIALLGANGNGKSTFAKLLAGRLKAETGTVTVAPGLEGGDLRAASARRFAAGGKCLRACAPADAGSAQNPRCGRASAQFGLSTEKMNTPAKDLSGGEKARLLMGLAAFEGRTSSSSTSRPTTSTSTAARALVHALNEFPGAVIVVSHDRHLLEATVDRLWLVKDGAVNPMTATSTTTRRSSPAFPATTGSGARPKGVEGRPPPRGRRPSPAIRAARQGNPRNGSAHGPAAQAHRHDRGRTRQSGPLREGPHQGDPASARSARARRPAFPATRKSGWRCRPNTSKRRRRQRMPASCAPCSRAGQGQRLAPCSRSRQSLSRRSAGRFSKGAAQAVSMLVVNYRVLADPRD